MTIDVAPLLQTEEKVFHPSEGFVEGARLQSMRIYEEAAEDREAFWAKQAQKIDWFSAWDRVLDWKPPYAQWFVGGKLNASYNCLDRHVHSGSAEKAALIWEGERGEQRTLTYKDLYEQVNRFSNVLKRLGVSKGDRVAIYLPQVPEAVVAMLSCARIGAVHTVVFAGFSSEALKDRIVDANAHVLITADGGFRKGKLVPLKALADEAIETLDCVQSVVVLKHTGAAVAMRVGRDFWYAELLDKAEPHCPPEAMDAEDPLYFLYTSGTTGKPKGIVHTTGGYMVGVTATTEWVFDAKPSDIYWCTADVGWVTGHSYVVYGPLSNGMTQVLYEGAFDWPGQDRVWKMIEKHRVSILYTAPTAIRMFMKWGEEWPGHCDLSSLRLLGSVGEPINPEAWMWYHKHIGSEKCPIVDTWWQTETGSIMIAPLPGLISLKPGSATFPLPGIEVAILDDAGVPNTSGNLAITSPWPSMMRGIHNNPERYQDTYWKKWEGKHYFTGDSAKRDEDGYYWLSGRVDDVINVSGHRLGTMEIESALVDHKSVAEAAAIAISHPIKGQAIMAFVILRDGFSVHPELEGELKQHITLQIGAIARPEKVLFICDLPKTRSGKIMRRLLRDIAEGRVVGDMTTLTDPSVIQSIKGKYLADESA